MITQNAVRLTGSMRNLLALMYRYVDEKFPGHGVTVIRSVIFLRLLCPAIVNPVQHSLIVRVGHHMRRCEEPHDCIIILSHHHIISS